MRRAALLLVAFALLGCTPGRAPSADWRPAAMHSFLTLAVSAADQQFRNERTPSEEAAEERLFGVGLSSCKVDSLWQPENRLKLICGPAPTVFGEQTDFLALVHNALPPGFDTAVCPKEAGIADQQFLLCLRNGNGVEIELVVDTATRQFHGKDSYGLRIVAPSPQIDRTARQHELSQLLAKMTEMAAGEFRSQDASRLASRYGSLLQECGVKEHSSGRRVLSCVTQNGRFATQADFAAAIHDALPQGFRKSACVQHGLGELICARNSTGVELAISSFEWPFTIYADDATRPDPRVTIMRSFFANVLPAAAQNFRGFSSNTVLPYFGHCDDIKQSGGRTYLACVLPQSKNAFEDDGSDGDYDAVVFPALPRGYAGDANACVLNVKSLEGEFAVSDCFGAERRPNVEIGRDDAGDWVMFVVGI